MSLPASHNPIGSSPPSSAPTPSGRSVPRACVDLLEDLRSRVRRYVIFDSVLAIVAVLLIGFWIVFALDYGPIRFGGTEMPRMARAIALGSILGIAAIVAIRYLIGRLRRPLPDDSLALLLERQHPELGGRLMTTVQLSDKNRKGDNHSNVLLDRVRRETLTVLDRVDPNRVFNSDPIRKKCFVVVPLLLAFIGMAIAAPNIAGQAVSRLSLFSDSPWPRRADLRMVGVELAIVSPLESEQGLEQLEFTNGAIRLPIGSNPVIRINAVADDAEVPVVCTMYYQTDSGSRGQINLRRVGRVRDGFQSFVLDAPPLAGLSESFEFIIRGLDDRLDGFRIEAVPPPVMTSASVNVRYPEYLRLDSPTLGTEGNGDFEDASTDSSPPRSTSLASFDRTDPYQSGIRVREGSEVVLETTSSIPLGELKAYQSTDGGRTLTKVTSDISEDGLTARVSIGDIRRPTSFQIVPVDRQGLSAQVTDRYYVSVAMDRPPQLEVRLKGIGSAITPQAMIPIDLVAKDDYGLADLRVSGVIDDAPEDGSKPKASDAQTSEASPEDSVAIERHPQVDRQGGAKEVIDLRELVKRKELPSPPVGGVLSLITEASDHYDLGEAHLVRGDLLRLDIVTKDRLLSLLERRELGLRARLEQTIGEMRRLRDTLSGVQADLNEQGLAKQPVVPPDDQGKGDKSDPQAADSSPKATSAVNDRERMMQIIRLRLQQSFLQNEKTAEELNGIVATIGDLILEMTNNRVDTPDRQDRLGNQVAKPLETTVQGPLAVMGEALQNAETELDQPNQAAQAVADAIEAGDQTILALEAVLESMLDLESYNEVLDLIRGLIEDQDELLDETKKEQKKRVLDLFK